MAAKCEPEFEIVQNKAAKSSVWTHYGFVKMNDDVDKRKVACRQCNFVLKYSGNTTNLTDHLRSLQNFTSEIKITITIT